MLRSGRPPTLRNGRGTAKRDPLLNTSSRGKNYATTSVRVFRHGRWGKYRPGSATAGARLWLGRWQLGLRQVWFCWKQVRSLLNLDWVGLRNVGRGWRRGCGCPGTGQRLKFRQGHALKPGTRLAATELGRQQSLFTGHRSRQAGKIDEHFLGRVQCQVDHARVRRRHDSVLKGQPQDLQIGAQRRERSPLSKNRPQESK